ncbi:PKD domain-containing protein [Cytophagaceae bacterium ABcell3]|nr:PKD domain-containing protein [Cytophagaceae bacterium ABcell3]
MLAFNSLAGLALSPATLGDCNTPCNIPAGVTGFSHCLVVTNGGDNPDLESADEPCDGTLRWAILKANTLTGGTYIKIEVAEFESITSLPAIERKVYLHGLPGMARPNSIIKLTEGSDGSIVKDCNFFELYFDNTSGIQIYNTKLALFDAKYASGIEIYESNITHIELENCQQVTVGSIGGGNIIGSIESKHSGGFVFQGNFIGNDGTSRIESAGGPIRLEDCNNVMIGGSVPGASNVIGGGSFRDLVLQSCTDVSVLGNKIGTNAAGTDGFNSVEAIYLSACTDITIGGTGENEGNLISDHRAKGIFIASGNTNLYIRGNKIGTDITGTKPLPNKDGIAFHTSGGSSNNTNIVIEGNLLSGNTSNGIWMINESGSVKVRNNIIGLTADGNTALANENCGILVDYCSGDIEIGAPGAGNTISGHQPGEDFRNQNGYGILLKNSSNTKIRANRIGTDISGTVAIGNYDGINISATSENNTIGGTSEAGNIIAGNHNGIYVTWGSRNNEIIGNHIGITAEGSILPNENGIYFDGVNQNKVGLVGAGNTVAGNRYNGIVVAGNNQTTISGNSIYESGKAISLVNNGNDNKEAPDIEFADVSSDRLLTVSGTAGNGDIVELFTSDASGLHAYEYLGRVSADNNTGEWEISIFDFNSPRGYVVATATSTGAYSSPGSTSELSKPYSVPVFVPEIRAFFTYVSSCENKTVNFEPLYDQSGASYHWDFGDGHTFRGRIASHTYEEEEKYNVTLTVRVGEHSHSEAREVLVGAPRADFDISDACLGQPAIPVNVHEGYSSYNWTVYDMDGEVVDHQENDRPQFLFSEKGQFRIVLEVVVNNGGETCRATEERTLEVNDGVQARIDYFTQNACIDAEALFTAVRVRDAHYSWTSTGPSGLTETFSSRREARHRFTEAGNHKVTLTVSNGGCQSTAEGYVRVAPRPDLSLAPHEDIFLCAGGGTVSLPRVTVRQTNGEFRIRWSRLDPLSGEEKFVGGQRDQVVSHAGTYYVRVENACGLSEPLSVQVDEKMPPVAAVEQLSPETCKGAQDGSAKVSVDLSGSEGSQFEIRWSSLDADAGINQSVRENLGAGNHYIKVTDRNGCVSVHTLTIEDASPAVSVRTEASSCEGNTGVAHAEVTGGAPSFNYQWFAGNSTEPISENTDGSLVDCAPGRYRVVVTDGNNCTVNASGHLGRMSTDLRVKTSPSCGDSEVKVTAEAVLYGGAENNTDPSLFAWNWQRREGPDYVPVESTGGAEIYLGPGDYRLEVTSSGCSNQQEFTIDRGDEIELTAEEVSAPQCRTGRASIIALASGGVTPLQYSWREVGNEEVLSVSARYEEAVADQTYEVEVTDKRGCTRTAEVSTGVLPVYAVEWKQPQSGLPCEAEVVFRKDGVVQYNDNSEYRYQWQVIRKDNNYEIDPGEVDVDVPLTEEGTLKPWFYVLTVKETRYVEGINHEPWKAYELPAGKYMVTVQDENGCFARTSEIYEVHPPSPKYFAVSFAWKKPDMDIEPEDVGDYKEEIAEAAAQMQRDILEKTDQCLASAEETAAGTLGEFCYHEDAVKDQLTISYSLDYYHYTLYYYDRAGNLTKTVPPQGVKPLDEEEVQAHIDHRKNGGMAELANPEHAMATEYTYNSLDQLVEQETPDGGITRFIYDHVGRLRFSQNDEQALPIEGQTRFSYTKYDKLGRVIEVGEHSGSTSFEDLRELAHEYNEEDAFMSFPAEGNHEITRTYYTFPSENISYYGQRPRFLKNNVSYVIRDKDGDFDTKEDQSRTHYSYDPHGNVEWLVQEVPGLGRQYLKYEYELVSGNVTEVRYNERGEDAFYHRYEYDADNRILAVHTSADGTVWEQDGNYEYYDHGPLKTAGIGHDKLQELNYTYTIHGWLKAVNNPHEGEVAQNGYVKDVFAFSLGYYRGDFKSGNNSLNQLHGSFEKELFNGNISSWTSFKALDLPQNGGSEQFKDGLTAREFSYDQLNRIKSSKFYTPEASTGQVNWELQANRFSTTYSYDGNGNLYHLGRHGRDNLIDNLRYEYYGEGTADAKNMLKRVTDEHDVAGNGMENDLKGTITYKYDRKGNLVAETGEHRFIDLNGDGELESHEEFVSTKLMEWDTYGKISAVYDYLENVQDNSRIRYVHYFTYDATGNRISKQEIKQENYEGAAPVIAGDGPHLENYYELIAAARGEHSPLEEVKTTYYVRDASGNVMSVYKRRIEAGEVPDTYLARFSLEEQPIYGSSRIGQHTPNKDMGEVAFTAGEFNGLSLNAMPRAARATLQNWLTASNRISEIDGQQSCACRIDRIDFGGGDVEPKGSFMGYNTNNIAVAEDYDGHLQFYTATTESYMGSENPVMLVFDRDGKLMENSYGMISSAKGKSIVMQSPERSQWYYIFTTSEQGVPYYHIVDMSAQGYGTTLGAAGRVISKNNVLDASGQYTYGRHFTFIEDRISNEGIVYAVRYRAPETADEPGLAQLVYFELRQGEMSAPVLLTGFESYDAEGAGELTLSEDGRILAYFNRKQHIAGFGYQSISIERLELEADHRTATVLSPISGTLAGTDDKGSVDFSGDGNMLYYNQHGLYIHNLTGSQSNIWAWGSSTQSALEGGAYGDVRRQGEVYIGSRNETQLKDVLAGGITLPDGDGFGLSGYLPVQGYRIRPAGREVFTREVGRKVYELADHLGNVQVVINDMRMMVEVQTASGNAVWEDRVAIVSSNEYYPFGMMMSTRSYSSSSYRYGFNGQEKDDEISGSGNSCVFTFRVHDARLGRFLSVDPLSSTYPWNSPYSFAESSPIAFIDLEGLERYYAPNGDHLGTYGTSTEIRVVKQDYVEAASDMLRNPQNYTEGTLTYFLSGALSVSLSGYAEDVTDVLNDAPLQTWANNGQNCNTAARAQMTDAGVTTYGSSNVIQTDVNNTAQTSYQNSAGVTVNRPQLSENKAGGAIYVMTQLKSGNPVMVGVKESTSTSTYIDVYNINALTGHFIVISGMSVDANGNITFRYYDNASPATGKSLDNQLQLNTTTGAMRDDSDIPVGGVESYEVSEVRTNQ